MALAARRPLLVLAAAGAAVASLALGAGTALAVRLDSGAQLQHERLCLRGASTVTVAAAGIEANVTALAIRMPLRKRGRRERNRGPNAGPGGEAEWLQTASASSAGSGSELYAESPGQAWRPDPGVRLRGRAGRATSSRSSGWPPAGQAAGAGQRCLRDRLRSRSPGSSGLAPMAMSEWPAAARLQRLLLPLRRLRVANSDGGWVPLDEYLDSGPTAATT